MSTVRRASGFIIYRKYVEGVQFLLLKASNLDNEWSPPKGHVDPGESELETAFRETEEEAGLKKSDITVVPNFEHVLNYEAWGKPKKVTYWLAEVKDPQVKVTLSHEHSDFAWSAITEALKLAKHEDLQKALEAAHKQVALPKTS